MASEEELIAARRRHIETLRQAGGEPYPSDFKPDDAGRREVIAIANDEARRAQLPGEGELAPDAEHYPLFGRVIAKRGPFLVIQTPYGSAQALVRPADLPAEDAAQAAVVDLADHVAVSGPLLRTRTGALTVKAARYRHVAKALLPPPDKWHGLSDVEKRYRERYVDMFANPDVAEVFRARSAIVSALRAYLDARGYLEVETPILHPLLGGATARPFRTHHNALDIPLYLRVAPELYLKRLLVGGLDRVYELGRTFRNEGVSTRHNPEFTLLELYTAYGSYLDLLDLTEQMLREVDSRLRARFEHLVGQRSFDLSAPFARATMRECIVAAVERSGRDGVEATAWSELLDREIVNDEAALSSACQRMLADATKLNKEERKLLTRCRSYGERVLTLFESIAEPRLSQLFRTADGAAALPVFVTEHPVESSPLARRNDRDPRFVDRFELFIEQREIANGFSELNDPDDQAARFNQQLENRERGDEEAMDFDHDYVRALQHGMPPAAGLGVGVDRLVMLLCGQASIRDVLLFPLLKPESR
jgi:lysyl-tRNA synthetase, class II